MLWLRHPLTLLLTSILVLLGVLRSFSTPAPVDAGAPDVVFSADRAEAILRDLLSERRPHVAGSDAQHVVRDRIMSHLRVAGYEPEIQSLFHCNPEFGVCSPVENIIATKPGSIGKSAVMLTAHYDSTWGGPGAADDGAGVAAVIEIARMAAEFPPFANDVVFLITDSEENGLIGADAFAQHHPLFGRVEAVINLEARGVTGPSAMFETGQGNRSVIRMWSKNVARPVGNSLTYEIYRRMPNDTDYSVYRRAGVMGLNFAFVEGVALYHSERDDPDHLDMGSLQHHGDNAWGMLKALGERDPNALYHREDAGYIDVFGLGLLHYPLSIAGGLALFLGVWVMIAITLAFRKEFRWRQLRWGLLAIPLVLVALPALGFLLSWPLGKWGDMPPLEHPYPWVGRLTIFLALAWVVYASLKLFSGRVSACAWMILAWALIFVLGIFLAAKLPGGSPFALVPLAMFAFGSVVDLFRKKSPAPLLVASVLGFAGAAFSSLYLFFLLDVVAGFDRSYVKIAPLSLMALAVMPMLLAFVRKQELSWRPGAGLAAAIACGCLAQAFLPAYTAERPRGMSFVYVEADGDPAAYLALESEYGGPDLDFAEGHGFRETSMADGRLGAVSRPAREVQPLGLPEAAIEADAPTAVEDGWFRSMRVTVPPGTRLLQVTVPSDAGLASAWVNGQLALDHGVAGKHSRTRHSVAVVNPGAGTVSFDLLTSSGKRLQAAVTTWRGLPAVLTAPFMGNWPDDALSRQRGPHSEKVQLVGLEAGVSD